MSNIYCSLLGVSATRAKSSAYIGDPINVPPIDTPELRAERDSRRASTKTEYIRGDRIAPWRTPWQIGIDCEVSPSHSTVVVDEFYQ